MSNVLIIRIVSRLKMVVFKRFGRPEKKAPKNEEKKKLLFSNKFLK